MHVAVRSDSPSQLYCVAILNIYTGIPSAARGRDN